MSEILDTLDVIKNLQNIYDSEKSFQVLKDYERVIDDLGVYVYENWEDGELIEGPNIERHWVTCKFMWPIESMPDKMGAKRLSDYNCKIRYKKSYIMKPRQIKKPGDIRPGTKKGKLDKVPIWVVELRMPKSLIVDIYGGSVEEELEKEQAQPKPVEDDTDVGAEIDNIGGELPAEGGELPPAGGGF